MESENEELQVNTENEVKLGNEEQVNTENFNESSPNDNDAMPNTNENLNTNSNTTTEEQLNVNQEQVNINEQQLNTNETNLTNYQSNLDLPVVVPVETYEQPMDAAQARKLASDLIHSYFTTQLEPLTKHQTDSYDQFIQTDLKNIIASHNPLILLHNPKEVRDRGNVTSYKYRTEIYIGGESGDEIFVGTPMVSLEQGQENRVLFPNEARLRNLTYALQIEANVKVNIKIAVPASQENPEGFVSHSLNLEKIPLCNIPLMLHSSYCMLHGKPSALLKQMGECPMDQGGYFIVDGSEKVLVTRQEGAFNTLWIAEQPNDEKAQFYASITSLNPKSREVKRVTFFWTREVIRMPQSFSAKSSVYKPSVLEVSIPFCLKPIPIMVLFRAMGVQSDRDILKLIFPDFNSPEAKLLADLLIPSINAAAPFMDTYSAIQYIKTLTKGFSEFHVLDILHNQLFIHVEDLPEARVTFLADCVRKILRVVKKLDAPPSRDDTRNQRLLTSGFMCQLLFQNLYKTYVKEVRLTLDKMFNYNETVYSNEDYLKLFGESNKRKIFMSGYLTEGIMRGFKGKWKTGPDKEEAGVLQELSRLSYLDFMSHIRRAVLNFDTGLDLKGPRFLHPSQYGYFCTSETPSGSHIGVTKNLSIMTAISINAPTDQFIKWLFTKGKVVPCAYVTPELKAVMIPVYLNSGIAGYSATPTLLSKVLRYMKRSGYLPPLSSSGFNIPERRIFIFMDDGRPLRPLIACPVEGKLPSPEAFQRKSWRDYVVGLLRPNTFINSRIFTDPLEDKSAADLEEYLAFFEKEKDKLGLIEYLDPYEQNQALLANVPEHVIKQTTHMEIHPSTIMGLLGNMIPYPNHNQSPRNQLSASQSKQGLSLYATNWFNRFDNTANVLCYGQAPLSRTIYQDYVGDGKMPYGQNIILAMGMYGGYNQEDGIIMNADALARGQFRSINYRSYEAFEEDDTIAKTKIRIANPKEVPGWMKLKASIDYSKLDDSGIIKEGSYVNEHTAIVGRYMMNEKGEMVCASVTPQVWTRGIVQKVIVLVNNNGLRLVKVRVVQDRVPELGDKFSNRHGQKGTLNVLYRGHDMPRTVDGIVPDMIMNPTAIPSRMTIGQILEMILGNVSAELGAIGNCTAFMNDGSPHEEFGNILEKLGLHRMCNQVLYNGMTGEQMIADIFMGPVYGMRLKHMTEDKWNARGKGRKEQRTHQPTGGRGNEGGLKIGEMERDAIVAHGITSFTKESYMERSDGHSFIVCNGCGTIPLYNEKKGFYLCPLCDGPIQYSGDNAENLEPIPPPSRSGVTFSKVEIPYATKLFFQEMETYMNMGFRMLTTKDAVKLRGVGKIQETAEINMAGLSQPLPQLVYPETAIPELSKGAPLPTAAELAKQIAELNDRAVTTYQTVDQAQAEITQQPIQQAQPLVQPLQQQVQLQPASIMPTLVSQQQPFVNGATITAIPSTPPEGSIVATTEQGAPIINVDTSDQTMRTFGLTQPRDATANLEPRPMMPPVQPPIRRLRRVYSQQPQQAQQMPYPQEQEGGEQQQQMSAHIPVKVVKLG